NIKREYVFVFVDNNSPVISYVEKIKKRMLEVKDASFCFLPSQQPASIFALYKQASLVVMTPKSDGAPVSAMEAMACKAPLILPPLNYDQDLFGEGVCRLNSRSPQELAKKIEQILTGELLLDVEKASY